MGNFLKRMGKYIIPTLIALVLYGLYFGLTYLVNKESFNSTLYNIGFGPVHFLIGKDDGLFSTSLWCIELVEWVSDISKSGPIVLWPIYLVLYIVLFVIPGVVQLVLYLASAILGFLWIMIVYLIGIILMGLYFIIPPVILILYIIYIILMLKDDYMEYPVFEIIQLILNLLIHLALVILIYYYRF